MLNRCIVEIEVSGKKRGFKFGMLAIGLMMQRREITFPEFLDKLGKTDILFTIDLLHAAAESWHKSKNLPVDFTAEDVADWMDEIGMVKAFSIINNAFTKYDPPVTGTKKKPIQKKTEKKKK